MVKKLYELADLAIRMDIERTELLKSKETLASLLKTLQISSSGDFVFVTDMETAIRILNESTNNNL